jgi:hypothetical protein
MSEIQLEFEGYAPEGDVEYIETIAPDTRPDILKRVDSVINLRKGPLLERIRKIKADEDIIFFGMTKAQIRSKFSMTLTGHENSAQLKKAQADAINLRIEAGSHLRDAEQHKKAIEEAYNACRSHVEGEIVIANITANRNEKISDKAREIISRQVYEVGNPDELAMAICEEVEWKGVVRDLDAFLSVAESNAMLLMSENKNLK